MRETTVNLLWQHRIRGLIPSGLNAVDDDGNALLIQPDMFATRTYKLLEVGVSGEQREHSAISVETVREFEILPGAGVLLAMTDDDLYIFREGRKSRFQPERRALYSDCAPSRNGRFFVAAFSDEVFASHGLIYGDIGGRAIWSKDLPGPVARTGVAYDGSACAVGLRDGMLLSFDHERVLLAENALDSPASAIAFGRRGQRLRVGTEAGDVLATDGDGGIAWRIGVGQPVLGIATDEAASWTAAVVSDGAEHRLLCLDSRGNPVWDYQLPAEPTGVCLSPSGRYLLVTLTSSIAMCFEAAFAAGSETLILDQARGAIAAGDLGRAIADLHMVLAADPSNVSASKELEASLARQVASHITAAEDALAARDGGEAISRLQSARELAPWDAGLFDRMVRARSQHLGDLEAEALRLEAAGDWSGTQRTHEAILLLDPQRHASREALGRVRRGQASALLAAGDTQDALGDMGTAITLWRKAQDLHPTPEVADRLRAVEIRRCLAAGIARYEAGRMAEAAFQFRRVLSLDPDHAEAQRYLRFASDGDSGDTSISSRFSRLE